MTTINKAKSSALFGIKIIIIIIIIIIMNIFHSCSVGSVVKSHRPKNTCVYNMRFLTREFALENLPGRNKCFQKSCLGYSYRDMFINNLKQRDVVNLLLCNIPALFANVKLVHFILAVGLASF